MNVRKANGKLVPLDIKEIQEKTKSAEIGLENVYAAEVEVDSKIQFFDGITTEEITASLIKTAVNKIDIDTSNYTFFASRLFIKDLAHKVGRTLGGIKGNAYSPLQTYFEYGEKNGKIIIGLKDKFNLNELDRYIEPKRDLLFTYLGIKTFYDRYILKNKKGDPFEMPQHLFMAVGMFVAQREENPVSMNKEARKEYTKLDLDAEGQKRFIRTYWAKRFYDMMSTFEVMAATPTLSNGRTPRHQLSSCYIGSTPDNIEGIFDTYKEQSLLSKFGGGIGWDWMQVRGSASSIDGTKGAAGGIVPFLKIDNDVALAVDQLGTRKGAIAVYVEPWHIDIEDFLSLKKNSGEERRRTHDLFPALWLNDIFMERVDADEDWTLFSPENVPGLTETYGKEFNELYEKYELDESIPKRVVKAKDIWKETLRQYFETGNPFLTFKDRANEVNPNKHAGIIRSSNLCVTGDIRLATQFGLVKAKELYKKEKKLVTTYDKRVDYSRKEKGVGTAKSIKMHKTAENAKVFKITTNDGYELKSTDWHEYYVLREKNIIKIPMKEINKDTDKLLIQSGKGQFGKEGSYDLGFVTGLVAGDGTISISRKEKQQIHIDLYNDDLILKDTVVNSLKQIEEDNNIKTKRKKEPKDFWHTESSKKTRISSINIGELLKNKYNFTKENKLKVPEFVFQGKEETVKGYLQGVFISDGTVNKIKNDRIPSYALQLGSISKEFLKEIQLVLSNYGIRSKISKMRDEKEAAFSYITVNGEKREYSSKEFFRLNINGRNASKFISEIGFIGKKQEKAMAIEKTRTSLGMNKLSKKDECFEVKIKEIEFIGNEDVYDTTQELNHSLIFNGLVTGNCTEIFQNTSPNKYLIEVEYEDGLKESFEEEQILTTDDGSIKPAKKISSLDSLNGKQVFFVGKEKIEGETAVCNLASVNLSKVNTKEKFEEIIPTAIRFLDNVIDLNFYPERKTKITNLKSRAIGLGVMGEAQMLAEAKIMFGTQEHFDKIDEIMEIFSYNAIKASSELAQEKGSYPNFEGSEWSKGIFPSDNAREEVTELTTRKGTVYDWKDLAENYTKKGMRNGYLMAIAPTSSISILTGTTQAIEPVFKRFWREENLSGVIPVVAPNLSPDTWQFYTPAFELDQLNIVKAGAVRQKWLDQGQSLNIFIDLENITGKKLHNIYMTAWKFGIKSTYYLRSQSPKALDEKDDEVEDRSQECTGCQ